MRKRHDGSAQVPKTSLDRELDHLKYALIALGIAVSGLAIVVILRVIQVLTS